MAASEELRTTPTEFDAKAILEARPGDQIYQKVKHHLDKVKEKAEEYKVKIMDIVLKDLYLDLALSNAIDGVGATLEYLAQDLGIETPEFEGGILMRNLQRIGKLKMSMEYGKLLDLNDEELDKLLKEESFRLWYDPMKARLAEARQKEQPQTLSLPDDFLNILRSLIKTMKK